MAQVYPNQGRRRRRKSDCLIEAYVLDMFYKQVRMQIPSKTEQKLKTCVLNQEAEKGKKKEKQN